MLARSAWGKGYASEALGTLTDVALALPGISRALGDLAAAMTP